MKHNFDGGDPTKPRSDVDISWNALEEKTFAITAATVAAYSTVFNGTNGTTAILPKNVNSYANGVVMNIPEAEAPVAGGPVTLANSSCFTHVLAVDKDITGAVIGTRIVSAEEWHAAAGMVPALKYFSMAEIEAINGAFVVQEITAIDFVTSEYEVRMSRGKGKEFNHSERLKIPKEVFDKVPENGMIAMIGNFRYNIGDTRYGSVAFMYPHLLDVLDCSNQQPTAPVPEEKKAG